MNEWELLTDFGLLVLIWIVQVLIYPGFKHLDPAEFIRVHKAYTHIISFFVVPLITAQLLMKSMRVYQEPRAITLASLGLVLLFWIATFFLAFPCYRNLDIRGKDLAIIHKLLRYNWIRTLGWSAVFMLNLWATS